MLIDCTISGNGADGAGGGLYNTGSAALYGCTISGNISSTGGGVENVGTAMLIGCTISGNFAATAGGGVYNGGAAELIGCTISGNSITQFLIGGGGGGVDNNDGVLWIGDTIVAGNTAAAWPDVLGNVTQDLGYNLVGGAGSGGFTAATDQLNQAAGLAPLGDYGGPTETMPLLPGSPAIGHGAAMGQSTDQRGFALDSPQPDVGAFQTQPGIVVNTTLDGVGSPAGELSLRQAVNLANVLGAATTITFDPIAFAAHQTIALTAGPLELFDTGGLQTITGPAAGLTIDAGGQSDVLQVDNVVTASLSGLTFSGGSAAFVGGILNQGDLTLAGCTISKNFGDLIGGIANVGELTLTACTVSGNSGSFGAGIGNYAQMTLTDCTISGNSAFIGSGGGVYNYGTATLVDCTVDGNSASQSGGGLFDEQGALTLTACTVSGNSAGQSGGGAYIASAGALAIGDTILAGNTSAPGPTSPGRSRRTSDTTWSATPAAVTASPLPPTC